MHPSCMHILYVVHIKLEIWKSWGDVRVDLEGSGLPPALSWPVDRSMRGDLEAIACGRDGDGLRGQSRLQGWGSACSSDVCSPAEPVRFAVSIPFLSQVSRACGTFLSPFSDLKKCSLMGTQKQTERTQVLKKKKKEMLIMWRIRKIH